MKPEEKLIGKKCFIIDKESMYFGEWGIITEAFNGEFLVAIANGTDSEPIFSRNQIRIPRNQIKGS